MKSQVPWFFNEWLDIMERAYDELDHYQFHELENKIVSQIMSSRRAIAKNGIKKKSS